MRKKRDIGQLMEFDRADMNENGFVQGYLLDYSDAWTLIHLVEGDIFFDGYWVLRNDTIKRYRRCDDTISIAHRALRNLGQYPVSPGTVDLTSVNTVVESANALFPLLVIHREYRWRNETHIGGIAAVSPKAITIASIDTRATYDGRYRIRSSDITKSGFQDYYSKALWAAASQKTKRSITSASMVTSQSSVP